MSSLRQSNSWHWLLAAMALSLVVALWLCYLVWNKIPERNDPEVVGKLEGMAAAVEELKLLAEEDVYVFEHQASEIQRRLIAYEAAAEKVVGKPIPEGEQSVLMLSNEINRALLRHELRVIEQEQIEVREMPDFRQAGGSARNRGNAPDRPEEQAALAAAAEAAAAAGGDETVAGGLPFSTREFRYVVEGQYKHMFMFLVRQSHLKPSYHFKDITITPAPQQAGMRMEFTLQIHYT